MKRVTVLLLALVLAAPAKAHSANPYAAAQVLAKDDYGYLPRLSRVMPYHRLLMKLETLKCRERRTTIARYSFNTRRVLRDSRISVRNLTLLRDVDGSLPMRTIRRTGKQACAPVFAYIALARIRRR